MEEVIYSRGEAINRAIMDNRYRTVDRGNVNMGVCYFTHEGVFCFSNRYGVESEYDMFSEPI